MWDEAARSNEAAYALSKEWGKPDLHSLQWLQYAYLQTHRYADAKRLLDEVKNHDEDNAHENMQIRYAVETGEWSAFDFSSSFGRGMRAIAEKRFDDAQKAIDSTSDARGPTWYQNGVGNTSDALRFAQLAIAAEEKLGVPSGPPDDFKPAHELYGELLLQVDRPKEALEQFQTSLLRTPNRAASLADAARAQARLTARTST